MALEFFLAAPQGRLIGLHIVETPADFRRFLCGHAAILVEVGWVVGHNHLPFPACAIPISRPNGRASKRRKEVPPRHTSHRAYTGTYATAAALKTLTP